MGDEKRIKQMSDGQNKDFAELKNRRRLSDVNECGAIYIK